MKQQLRFTIALIIAGVLDGVLLLILKLLCFHVVLPGLKSESWLGVDVILGAIGALSVGSMVLILTLLIVFLLEDWCSNWVDIFRGDPPSSTFN